MRTLTNIDLSTDPAARFYVKDEVVDVSFAQEAGELISREGPNRFQVGDAIITSSSGDRWSVAHDRFVAKYDAVSPTQPGEEGRYRARPVPVLAKRIDEAFTAARSAGGDMLTGRPGDWLLQYGPGDFGVAEQTRFAQVYRPASDTA